MGFLVDECTGPVIGRWLRGQGHEVYSVYEESRGIDDDDIINIAYVENWTITTNDKDFGEKVYREKYPHRGVILLRLEDNRVNRARHLVLVWSQMDCNGHRGCSRWAA